MQPTQAAASPPEGLLLSPALIEDFLVDLERRGRTAATCQLYRKKLTQLRGLLAEDQTLRAGTLLAVRRALQARGDPNRSINVYISAANSLLEYAGRRELQLPDALEQTETICPELSRSEYLRLLSAAKAADKHRSYLLVKTLVNTGLYARELPLVTVEAAEAGRLSVPQRGIVPITRCLCDELLAYCRDTGRRAGAVFVTSDGRAMSRTYVNGEIKRLAEAAQVAPEKCTPMALRRLYLATQEQLRGSLALLLEQSHDRLFETENLTLGWDRV